MSSYTKAIIMPPEIQSLFAQIYSAIVASLEKGDNSAQVQKLKSENKRLRSKVAELDEFKAELQGIVFAFQEAQKQIMVLTKENERLYKGGEPKIQEEIEPTTEATDLEDILESPVKSSKAKKDKSSTDSTKSSKSRDAVKKSSPEPVKAEATAKPTTKSSHPWKVGTSKIQKELINEGVLTRKQCEKIKKTGTRIMGKDGSTWKFVGRNPAQKNAKVYKCAG